MFDSAQPDLPHLQHMTSRFRQESVGRLVTRVTTTSTRLNEMFTAGVVRSRRYLSSWLHSLLHVAHELELALIHLLPCSRLF